MPNWCWNNLEVTGDEIQLREFVEKSTINIEENDEFTFTGTYPMPKEFEGIHTGAYTDENGVSHRRWKKVDGKNIPISDKEIKQLEEKYGSDNWYDWCNGNWGTKWDACESYIANNDINFFSVSFDTAWAPPINWLKNIVKDYPGLNFELRYEEPGMAFGGTFTIQRDHEQDAYWNIEAASDCCNAKLEWDDIPKDMDDPVCLNCGETSYDYHHVNENSIEEGNQKVIKKLQKLVENE